MEKPPFTGPPDSFFPIPSPEFTEDLQRYQAKRQETWYNSTEPSKRRVVGTDGETRLVDVRTLTSCWHQRWRQTTSRAASKEELESWRLAAQEERLKTSKPTEADTSKPTKAATQNVPQDCSIEEKEVCAKEVAEPSQNLLDAPSASQDQQLADC